MIACVCVSCSLMSDSLRSLRLQPIRLLCQWNSLGKNTRVGCHSLLQAIFLTQGSNLGLLHCRLIFFFYLLSYLGSPRHDRSLFKSLLPSFFPQVLLLKSINLILVRLLHISSTNPWVL